MSEQAMREKIISILRLDGSPKIWHEAYAWQEGSLIDLITQSNTEAMRAFADRVNKAVLVHAAYSGEIDNYGKPIAIVTPNVVANIMVSKQEGE